MGASNVIAVYALYAGKVPPLSMQCLAYMAVVSKDEDAAPWYGQGHAALAVHALGRPTPLSRADIAAVERAVSPLLAVGAIVTDRRASVRRDGAHTARYRLQLDLGCGRDFLHVPRIPEDVKAEDIDGSIVDNPAEDSQRPTDSVLHVPRNSEPRPTESVTTSHEFRGTEEPGGTRRSKEEEESQDLRTGVAVHAREAATDPDHDSASQPTPDPRGRSPSDGFGFCLACHDAGKTVLADDPVHGNACPYHLRIAA